MNPRLQFYEIMLESNICEVIYDTKGAGPSTLHCTLKRSEIASYPTKPIAGLNSVSVWDVHNRNWVVLHIDDIESFKVLSTSLAETLNPFARTVQSQYTGPRVSTPTDPAVAPADVLAKYQHTSEDARRQKILEHLRAGTCEAVFTKVDNTVRTMKCTLNPKFIVAAGLQTSGTSSTNQTSNDRITVVDVDKLDWRSFCISRLQSFKPLEEVVAVKTPSKRNKLHPK